MRYGPLLWRVTAVTVVLVIEMVLRKAMLPELPEEIDYFPLPGPLYSLPVAWAGAFAILLAAGGSPQVASAASRLAGRPPDPAWLLAHLLLVAPVVWPSLLQGIPGLPASTLLLQIVQHVLLVGAVLALLLAAIAPAAWRELLRGSLPLVSLALAIAAVLAYRAAQDMWLYAAGITFRMVSAMLAPFYPDLYIVPDSFAIGSGDIEVHVSEVCSGLEGVGLILVFCAGWLWYLRREFRFPRALLLLPAAALLVFLLNALRIVLLFVIAAQGHFEIARAGFHSQAGWIFFNAAAFGVALVSRRIGWIRKDAPARPAEAPSAADAPVAAFLLPMLVVLATGMLTRAASAGFDSLYWLRLPAALVALLLFRRSYAGLDWRFGWRGIAAGVAVFALWLLAAHWLSPATGMPEALAGQSAAGRSWWILNRALIASLIVPVVEELAFRGFLMRRIAGADFASIRFADVRVAALLISSLVFGLSHGSFWLPGTLAGLLFGAVAIRTNRFGEAVCAHAVANALLAATVLLYDQWQLW